MQSQGLIFALLMLSAIPLSLILSDHEVFFIIAGFYLLVTSIKNSHVRSLRRHQKMLSLFVDSDAEEYEEETGLDFRKINTGTRIVKSLVIILFILYCNFYTSSLFFDLLTAFICVYHINDIIMYLKHYKRNHPLKISKLKGLAFLGVNFATAVLIVVVAFNKFTRYKI